MQMDNTIGMNRQTGASAFDLDPSVRERTDKTGKTAMFATLAALFSRSDLLQRGREQQFTTAERLEYVRAFGRHSLSTSLLAPGMRFFDVPCVGFIAFKTWRRSVIALSDPISAPKDFEPLIKAFLDAYPGATFVQVSEPVAQILNRRFGLYATQLGVETELDLEAWTLRGRKKQALRTAVNQAEAHGISVVEGATRSELAALSSEWLATRRVADTEMAFLVRPLDMEPAPGARVFGARDGSKLIGFVCFDPIFEDGKIVGYVPNVSRASAAFRQGIFYAIVARAAEQFQLEGVRVLNLGLAPLVLESAIRSGESGYFKRLLGAIYRHGNRLYNFKGIHFTKSRFRGDDKPVFVAHRAMLPLADAFAVFKLSRVF